MHRNKRETKSRDDQTKNMLEYLRSQDTEEVEVIKERNQNIKQIAANLEQEKKYQKFLEKQEKNSAAGSLARRKIAPSFKAVFSPHGDDEDDENDE